MNTTFRTIRMGAYSGFCMSIFASMLTASSLSFAQTCAAPAAWPSNGILFSGTTCGGEHVADSFCNSKYGNPGPDFVVRIFLNHKATAITLSGGAAGFDPVMYLADGADSCDSADCVAVGAPGTPIALAGIPPGEYWLFIAASEQNDTGACGSFVLTADGDLSGNDFIFTDGFEG